MPKQPELISVLQDLCRRYEHDEAERLLDAALADDPHQPELWAELGILYCYTQREAKAAELLKRSGGERASFLREILIAHFECRQQMAKKLGGHDPEGAKLLAKLEPQMTQMSAGDLRGSAGLGSSIKLSACLIVKNEEANLDRCLSSIQGVVDEIIVVDTGSTDRTIEIARQHGAIISHFEWCDDFADARNESLRLATGDWALWIDADEELDPKSFNGIREGLIRPHFAGYYIQIENLMDEEGEANKYVHAPVRLFRRPPGIAFTGRVHEQITPSLSKLGLPYATIENALIRHYGYRPSEMESKGKVERTLSLLQRQVEEEPEEAFHWFNLANAHTVGKDYEAAANAAIQCIKRLDSENAFGSLTYQLLQTALIELGRPEEALARSVEAETKGFAGILTEFERAHALSRLGRYDEALASIEKGFELEWPRDLTGDYGIVTHKRHLLKGQILAQMGRHGEAIELLDHVLTVDPANAQATFAKAVVLEKLCDYDGALAHFERAITTAQRRAALQGAARVHLALGRAPVAAPLAEEAWELKPEDREAWDLWIVCCEAAGDHESTARAYERFLEHFEATPEILVNWGRALAAQGEHEAGIGCYREAIKLAPSDPNAYFNAGDLLYALGQYQEAANIYQAGLHFAPGSAQAWFVLGNCFARLGVVQGAVLAYGQALEIDPAHAGAASNLSLVQEAA